MISETSTLSTFRSQPLSSTLEGVSFKQFKRTYPGNFSINFASALSASNDFVTKNYTNLHLTNKYLFSDLFDIDNNPLKTSYIFGPILYGGNYLKFSPIDSEPYATIGRYQEKFNYGVPVFGSEGDDFTIQLFSNNRCNIFYTKEYKKYYLCLDEDNGVAFVKESGLDFSTTTINPQDFTYLYSEDETLVLFFKKTETSNLFITKNGDSLVAIPVIDDNIITYIANPFKVSKNIYSYPNISLNTSFITYNNNDNNIDSSRSNLNQHNNFLIHKKYSNTQNYSDVLVLKNQLLQRDVFSSSNNLLSGTDLSIYSDNLREYTSISNDIQEEETETLNLNYVFYNKSYTIRPGSNLFVAPSSLVPFTVLNINDTKFINSGAFSYTTPEYADKVYHLSNDTQNYNNNQHLLCTWLSGHPMSDDKVWVDRYYYPDLIKKEEALVSKPIFEITYDDYVESLIDANAGIQSSIASQKFFDKISDLAFVADGKYRYDRITFETFPSLSSSITTCSTYSKPPNYFKKINNSGEMTLSFDFSGDSSEWIIKSDRNAIDSGITIQKTPTSIIINIDLYDATQSFHDTSEGSWFRTSMVLEFKQLKNNFLCIGINSKTGLGYFYLNNDIVSEFNLPIYQFLTKRLLYGDFYIYQNNIKTELLNSSIVDHILISDEYIDSNLVFILSLLNANNTIDDIYITLPCGMRNSIDEIVSLNSVCGSSTFKSNSVNVIIKNLGISNQNILNGIKDSITTSISRSLPVNTSINNVEFQNFK